MKICLKYQKYAKTITCNPNFVICLSSLFTVQDSFATPCRVKSELGFLKTYDKIWVVWDSFSIFLIISTKNLFQGYHIWAVLAIHKHMATLKIKSDPVLLLRKPKNP